MKSTRCKFYRVAGCIIAALLLYTQTHYCFAASQKIAMYVGGVKTLQVGKVTRVAIGLESILATSVLESGKLLLIPKAAGETDLNVWTEGERLKTFRVRILPFNKVETLATIRNVMRAFPNVNIRAVEEFVVVDGKVPATKFELYESVLSRFPNVVSLVSADDVEMKDMINFKVQILEVNKNYAKDIGVAWARSVAGPNVGYVQNIRANGRYVPLNGDDQLGEEIFDPNNPAISFADESSYPYLGVVSALTSRINLWKEDGVARTLAEPYLSTRSGGDAVFHSGGSYPLAILNEFGQPVVEMQDYGIQLNIQPISDEQGNIISSVRAEMSSIDFSTTVNGVPGLLTRATESVVNVRSGDTIIISGLVNVADSKSVEKMPFLGDIPLLGELFTSKRFNESKSELIILVTPEITKSSNSNIPEHMIRHLQSIKKTLSSTEIEEELLN